jgi:hypothetical protein
MRITETQDQVRRDVAAVRAALATLRHKADKTPVAEAYVTWAEDALGRIEELAYRQAEGMPREALNNAIQGAAKSDD